MAGEEKGWNQKAALSTLLYKSTDREQTSSHPPPPLTPNIVKLDTMKPFPASVCFRNQGHVKCRVVENMRP